MEEVTVFQFEKYDIVSDQAIRSKYHATKEAIESFCANPVGEGVSVDSERLDGHKRILSTEIVQ
ncbi:hypothetical protein [Chromobacterium sp. ATCC 53434]|uniref:hypothetical protein n=1 Tax=Chromobacterium sp. (strain ATCC 53434 / SC 14030) TaxID=2059672 RepID=UPI0013051E86|nr:hypothetical protein [Chromobacterium sp. ATCC 53434]